MAVYSSSRPRPPQTQEEEDLVASPEPAAAPAPRFRWPKPGRRAKLAGLALIVAGLGAAAWTWLPQYRGMSQAEVAAVVQKAIEESARPDVADAYEKILPSLVRVRALAGIADPETSPGGRGPEDDPAVATVPDGAIGTGVVIVDNGTILTNLHVISGARRLKVTFFDGTESDARIIASRPEHDLAVIKADKIPDDLVAATIRSTNGLRVGDTVGAAGFPFGIGPSASSGVVSGLKRDFRSASGERILSNLIQFDAAVNPGNSGGPLFTTEGEVVGIVTGLLNPTEQRVFVGIGFAVPIENAAAAAGLTPF
jgi:S1-C subfamily serine protease